MKPCPATRSIAAFNCAKGMKNFFKTIATKTNARRTTPNAYSTPSPTTASDLRALCGQ